MSKLYTSCQILTLTDFRLVLTSSRKNPSAQINQTVNIALARKYQKKLYRYFE